MSRAQRSSSLPTIMQVRDATVGPLSGTNAVSTSCTSIASNGTPERIGHDLRVHRPRALADLGAGRRGCARRVAVSSSDAFDASLTSPPPVKPEPWKNSDRPMPRFVPRHCRRFCLNCDRFTASRSTGSALASLPSFCPVAVVSPGLQRVELAQPHRIDAERLGDAIHVRFDGELRLRRAEPAERAVGRRVRHHRAAADANVIAAVRAGGVNHAARQHHGAQRRVGAAVHDHVDVHRGQAAVARQAGAMPHDRRVPLGRRQQILDAVVDHLHRAGRPCARGSPRGTPASTDTLPCRRSRRRFRSGRRAPGRAAGSAARPAPCARSTGTAAIRRRSSGRRPARRSRRWFRYRAAPGGRCGTRLRSRNPHSEIRDRDRLCRSRSVLKHRSDGFGIVVRRRRPRTRSSRACRCRSARACRHGPRAGSARRRAGSRRRPGTADRDRSARRSSLPGMSRWSATMKSGRQRHAGARRSRRAGWWSGWSPHRACPGNVRSSMYFAAPVTLASPSLRRTFDPTARATLGFYPRITRQHST